MWVIKCDICGEEATNEFRVKGLKVEENSGGFGGDVFWKKKHLCSDCRRNIVRAVKMLKAGLDVNEVFVRKEE